ncbi:hypothetical protein [Candidatus Desulfosporosinus nitrosoreducens]|uniref:hypothetical protein n=1 Tax=Candidatus Desulfosporosinus nitrosoreducens TaxID=3401928 RepID=UPI00280BD00A|nr:hypothetical protein [Desulfosporosinus sp. PR]
MDLLDASITAKETPEGAQVKANTAEANSKGYTDTKIASLVADAPMSLDTLKKLSDALGDDPNFAATINNQMASKVDQTTVNAHLADEAQLHAQWDAQNLTLVSGNLVADALCWLGKAVKVVQGSSPSAVSLGNVSTSSLRFGKFSAAFRLKCNSSYTAPTTAPTVSYATNASSPLINTTYYVKYTWVYTNGAETGASPEKSYAIGATGRNLVVTVPVLPSGAVATKVYIGTATGTETYQGQTTTTAYTQSTALTTGISCPPSGDFVVTNLKVTDQSDGNAVVTSIMNTDIVDVANYQIFYVPFENKGTFSGNVIKFSLTCEAHPTLEIDLDSIIVELIHPGTYVLP